jgi:hypothetical protein
MMVTDQEVAVLSATQKIHFIDPFPKENIIFLQDYIAGGKFG